MSEAMMDSTALLMIGRRQLVCNCRDLFLHHFYAERECFGIDDKLRRLCLSRDRKCVEMADLINYWENP